MTSLSNPPAASLFPRPLSRKPVSRRPLCRRLTSGAAACLGLLYSLSAQNHLFTFAGDQQNDRLGIDVRRAGDVNNDGVPDVIVGAENASPKSLSSAGIARVFSGRDGRLLHAFEGDAGFDRLGASVSGAGDVNRDGYADLIVGANGAAPNGKTDAGIAKVFSGKDGSVLYKFEGDANGDGLGSSVDGPGDVNLDGYPDLIVGAFGHDRNNMNNVGMARVYSGKDGSVLFTFFGDAGLDSLGREVSGAGDVDKDGHPDLIAGAPNASPSSRFAGYARVYSGKDGTVIRTHAGTAIGQQLGSSVRGADDVNLDGYADVIIGAAGATVNGNSWAGLVRVFSGLDGSVLHTFEGQAANESLGDSVSSVGDANKDGYPDLAAGAPGASPNNLAQAGIVRVYSGKDGTVIDTFTGRTSNESLGGSVDGVGDVNSDGTPDWIAGAPFANSGSARVFSGRKLSLWTDTHSFSVAQADIQTLTIDASAGNKNAMYWLFGSVTGTSPGVSLGGVTVPLQPDAWTDLTIQLANSAALVNTKGTLDANGMATSQIQGAPVGASFIGIVFYHAALVYDAQGRWLFATNPTTLVLEK